MVITTIDTTNLPMNFHHVPISTRPRARAPITIPEVGAIKFKTPDADWQAVTIKLPCTLTNYHEVP